MRVFFFLCNKDTYSVKCPLLQNEGQMPLAIGINFQSESLTLFQLEHSRESSFRKWSQYPFFFWQNKTKNEH